MNINLAFQSETHLGDCILHVHFLLNLLRVNDNIDRIYLYQFKQHAGQVNDYLRDFEFPEEKLTSNYSRIRDRIIVCPYEHAPAGSHRGWVGQFGIPPLPCALDQLRFDSYNTLCRKLNIKSPFKDLKDLLFDHPRMYKLDKFGRYDVLLINSVPMSGQTSNFEEEKYAKFARDLVANGKTVITTKAVEGIDCTMAQRFFDKPTGTTSNSYTVLDIGCLSIKAKYIIGLGTGPMICCLNVRNKEKKFIYIDQHHYFNMPYFNMIQSLDQIEI